MSVMGKLDNFIANVVYDFVPSWRKEEMRREWYRLIHGRVEKCDHGAIMRGLPSGFFAFCPYCGKGFRGREPPLRRTGEEKAFWLAILVAFVLLGLLRW